MLLIVVIAGCASEPDGAALTRLRVDALEMVVTVTADEWGGTECVQVGGFWDLGADACPQEDETAVVDGLVANGVPANPDSACTWVHPATATEDCVADTNSGGAAVAYWVGCVETARDGSLVIPAGWMVCDLAADSYQCTITHSWTGWHVGGCTLTGEA